MADPIAVMSALICVAICVRLVTFRRAGARYRLWVSLLAYLLAASTGCQALASFLGMYQVHSPFILAVLAVLCVLVFRAQGNVASIVRLQWPERWDGVNRRGEASGSHR